MKVFIYFFLLVLIAVGLAYFYKSSQNKVLHPAIKLINPSELKLAIASNDTIQLVDVRKPMEVKNGFITPSVNIDYFRSDFDQQFKDFNKDEPLYLYCRSGNRSGKAAEILANQGFKQVFDLDGGFKAWNH